MKDPKAGVDRAIEHFAETGWLRALIAMIPVAGPALDALVTSAASEVAKARFEHLATELRSIGERLDTKFDRELIDSPEWQDLAVRTVSAAVRTRDFERRRAYAGILLGSATRDWPKDLDNEAALSALAELSLIEVRLLRHLHEQSIAQGQPSMTVTPATDAWNHAVEALPADLREDLAFHVKRIERSGFIAEVTGGFLGYGGGVYFLTTTFVRLVAALENAGVTI